MNEPHATWTKARGKRFVVGKRETVHGGEKGPYATQGHRTSTTNPMERLR
jgi:hypothetical protein